MFKFRSQFLNTPIAYLKGVGPIKAEVLQKELQVFTFGDLLHLYPFRYVDKTQFHLINTIKKDTDNVQIKGTLVSLEKIKGKRQSRLVGMFKDPTGFIELVWFRGANWIAKTLKEGDNYIVFGKITFYAGKKSMAHPEIEAPSSAIKARTFDPIYSSTDKLNAKGLDSKARKELIKSILEKLKPTDYPESLSTHLLNKLKVCNRLNALKWIHLPENQIQVRTATDRIKFDELFFLQLKLLITKKVRKYKSIGISFSEVGSHFLKFYKEKLPFELTGAQKRVVKEIRADLGSGKQMNRLLQGDVGSGKTMVGMMCMLLAIDNNCQACLMAPTEILAYQHFKSISEYLEDMGLVVAFLSGSIKGKKRKLILEELASGKINIIIGTHALIEPIVIFKNLGIAIIDEQHRFGVAQRAKLWNKNSLAKPHILVMTATPIPRTLAMTVYGDLDVSVIDELPPGRKAIKTVHKREQQRPQLIQFLHHEIAKGRQIYIVYPLIEESAKLDLQNLHDGYEGLLQYFPKPKFQISVVHGRMKAQEKELEMQRFAEHKTQLMVATTVIEVGVNVPNASVMVIENSERFGLSQLHQLRGRVGRGAEQSFCILMSGNKLSKESKKRIQTMVGTNDGFRIAEADLELRGPGDLQGTQQSGTLDFRLVNLITDQNILHTARQLAIQLLEDDPQLTKEKNKTIKQEMLHILRTNKDWTNIS